MAHTVVKIDNEQEWHKERAKGLGGSDVSALAGKSPYKTNVDLWKEKTGRAGHADLSGSAKIQYGKLAEDFLRNMFLLDYPQYAISYGQYDIHRHKDYEFVLASLDGELTDSETGEKGILEIKTTTIRKDSDWAKWDDQIPVNYLYQILHYMLVDDEYKFCKLKVQMRHTDDYGETEHITRHYHIRREDYELEIADLLAKEREFWHYVETDTEPPLIEPSI